MLYTPERHEPLDGPPFDERTAREAIARIAERAEREHDAADGRWPLDPADVEDGNDTRGSCLYFGAAGIVWALADLASRGFAAPGRLDPSLPDRLEQRIAAEPDDTELDGGGLWLGVAGVLAVAERLWPDAGRRDRLAELARASLDSPALEPVYGHPGYLPLLAELHGRTGEPRWASLWQEGAERLLAAWQHDAELDAWLWTQQIGGHAERFVGAGHGLVGNASPLLRGDGLLDAARRAQVERRAVDGLTRLAVVEDGRANWPPAAGLALAVHDRIRVQWCHGAPGVLTGLWDAAPDDEAWSELLLAAGRLVWEAGPLREAPAVCHGTAGNAYALLALWRRTGDERWRERARAFAAHAARQVEARAARLGHGWHSLYTGDEGVALCLAACLDGDARLPVVDRLLSD